jgi:hypothetical protein
MLWAILLLLVAACAVGYLVADVAIHEAIEEEVERRVARHARSRRNAG